MQSIRDLTLKQRVKLFWTWFTLHGTELERLIDATRQEFAAIMIAEQLQKLNLPSLCEVDRTNDGYVLSLSPCGNKTHQFVTRFWAQSAPIVEKWQFNAFRKPSKQAAEELIRIAGKEWDPEQFAVYCAPDDEVQKYRVCVVSAAFQPQTKAERQMLARMIFYLFLGEAYTELYIGEVDCTDTEPKTPISDKRLSLAEFCEVIRRTPLERPWNCVNDPTTLCFGYQGTESHSDAMREDILGGFSRHMPLLATPYTEAEALLEMGGVFCYLYYAPVGNDPRKQAEERATLTMRVEQLLDSLQLGYVLGGAQGTDFSYIDLMIFDEPAFRAVFRDAELLFEVPMNMEYFGRTESGEYIQ